MEWIQAERDRFERAGMIRDFQQEYLLRVDTSEAKPFQADMLRSVDMAPGAWLPRVAIYDPSRTASVATSDRTGKVVVSRMGSKIIVHESGGFFWKPDEIREDVFECFGRHHLAKVAIEKDSLDEFLLQPIRYEMLRRGVVIPLQAVNAPKDRDKAAFIMGLEPFFRAGDIVLVGGRGMHAQLVAEILNFPGGKKDILNALAYSLRMFAGQPIYEDFGEDNIGPVREPTRQERIYLCWNATQNEAVCTALLVSGRYLEVSRDWAACGPITDCVKTLAAQVKTAFPRGRFENYASAQMHDNLNRVSLVPALRGEGLIAWRGEHVETARGCLAEPIRTTVRERRLLTVSKDALLTLNALAGGYKYPIKTSGQQDNKPEPGLSCLVAEALESCVATLTKVLANDSEPGNYSFTPQGAKYRTALPRRV
jgi:hypothetical protein